VSELSVLVPALPVTANCTCNYAVHACNYVVNVCTYACHGDTVSVQVASGAIKSAHSTVFVINMDLIWLHMPVFSLIFLEISHKLYKINNRDLQWQNMLEVMKNVPHLQYNHSEAF